MITLAHTGAIPEEQRMHKGPLIKIAVIRRDLPHGADGQYVTKTGEASALEKIAREALSRGLEVRKYFEPFFIRPLSAAAQVMVTYHPPRSGTLPHTHTGDVEMIDLITQGMLTTVVHPTLTREDIARMSNDELWAAGADVVEVDEGEHYIPGSGDTYSDANRTDGYVTNVTIKFIKPNEGESPEDMERRLRAASIIRHC